MVKKQFKLKHCNLFNQIVWLIFLLREECKYKTKCRERERERERERLWILLPARPALTERLAQLESAGS